MMRTSIPALAVLLVFAACADTSWNKPGADTATVSRDLDDCRGAALRNTPPPGATASQDPQTVDRGGAPNTGRPAASTNERFIAEHEAVRLCMQRRGYQLR